MPEGMNVTEAYLCVDFILGGGGFSYFSKPKHVAF